ncbi:MAG: glycoside hydrolase family 27 protein [Terriglobales bacterium]
MVTTGLRDSWRKLFVVAAWVFYALSSLQAQSSFTGRWSGSMNMGPNDSREYTFFLNQQGQLLSGAMLTGYRTQQISEGKVNGDEASWVTISGSGERQRRTEYRAQMHGGELQVTVTGMGSGANAAPRQLTVTKTSSDPTPVAPFANLPKITPPAIHAVADNGLARTPPMGWNSWNHFHRQIDDKTVREIADAMATNGMRDAGYVYVNIDDTWEGTRDEKGNIRSNDKFPDMKALADYVHSKGLKLGIYSSPGPRTCANFEGSYGHEQQDAKTWASWGIDYLKYDWCSASEMFKPEDMQAVYQIMGDALRTVGRQMVFSLCQYGEQHVEQWGAQVSGNLWRTTGDIGDNWKSMSGIGFDKQIGLEKYAAPGHWNDPDMLEIGNGGMSDAEYSTHMSLWAILAAPLLAGNDLRSMSAETRDILENRDVIAVDQDRAGHQGYRLSKDGDKEVWVKQLSGGDWALGLFNRGEAATTIATSLAALKIQGIVSARDLWTHNDRGQIRDQLSAEVPAHGVALLRLTPAAQKSSH